MNRDHHNVAMVALLMAGLAMPDAGSRESVQVSAPPVIAQAEIPSTPTTPHPPTGDEDQDTKATDSRNKSRDEPVMRSGIPEGFEAYMAPQKTLVDVYFGGRFVLSAMVEYTPETIEFLNPERVIRELPGIAARPILLNHFRGPQPTHGDRVCRRPGQEDCGSLSPDFIGVIFDERNFRADLFVHPDLMAEAERSPVSHLPEPDDRYLGLVQNLSANHAGSDLGDDRFSLFGRTLAGVGTQHLFSSWVSTDEQDFSVDELGLRKDFPDHQLNLGLYEPETMQLTMLRRQPIAGIGLKRSFERRRDLDTAFSTGLEVFLTNRSRVELIKDGRLYDARFYEAGNRSLDTERLPGGAYNVQIRITDPAGRTRTIERFFVKSRRLAPADEHLWFANLGRVYLRDPLAEFPEDAGTLQATAGIQLRHDDSIGLGLAGAAIEDAVLTEASADWLSPQLQTFASVFASSAGGAGWLLRGSASYEDARLIVDTQRVQADDPEEDAEYSLLPDDIERDSVEVRVPGQGGQYFASWRRLQRNDADEQRIATLGYTRTLRVGTWQTLNLNASLSRAEEEDRVLLSLDWRFVRPQWQHQASLSWRDSDNPEEHGSVGLDASSTWLDGNTFVDDVQLTGGVDVGEDSETLSLQGRHESQYGEARGNATWTQRQDQQDQTLTSASLDSNVLANGKGVAVGAPELDKAGVIIDLRGADGALFDVLVDGRQRFVARGGRRAALTLDGYDTYRVAIRDRGTDFVHYDNSTREVTLYPGNVATLSWELERVIIVLGKLMRPDGRPLGDVIIDGTRGVTTTDPDGYFQGEVLGEESTLFATLKGERCRLETGEWRVQNGVARLGKVLCQPVSAAANEAPDGEEPAGEENATPQ